MFFIYIIYSKLSDLYYIGYSNDPWRRLIEHNSTRFNTYTSKHRPWILKAVFECSCYETDAKKMERFIKNQKSRRLIEKLIDANWTPSDTLAQLVIPKAFGTHMRD